MSYSLALEFMSIFWGLGSSLFFSLGILVMKKESLRIISSSFYGGGEQMAVELAQQKLDFRFGAAFLFLSFFVLLLQKLFSPILTGTFVNNFWLGVATTLVASALPILICVPFLIGQRKLAAEEARRFNA